MRNQTGFVWLFVLLVIAVLAGGAYFYTRQQSFSKIVSKNLEPTSSIPGEITADTSGNNVYRNAKYGIELTYPKGWYVGDNNLGNGTFQIFNYDPSTASGKDGFPAGENKVEFVVAEGSPENTISQLKIDPHADYPIKSFTNTRLQIDGQNSIKTETDLVGGEKIISYMIPLKATPNLFLSISMYGDPSNFSALDQIVQKIHLLP